mgnify:CR=1 FL=1
MKWSFAMQYNIQETTHNIFQDHRKKQEEIGRNTEANLILSRSKLMDWSMDPRRNIKYSQKLLICKFSICLGYCSVECLIQHMDHYDIGIWEYCSIECFLWMLNMNIFIEHWTMKLLEHVDHYDIGILDYCYIECSMNVHYENFHRALDH